MRPDQIPGAGRLLPVDAESLLASFRERVDRRLGELLPDESEPPAELHAAMRYSALAPGKRLRPALCVLSGCAVGGSEADVLDAACAIELVHSFSLIHDDLPAIDNDDLRRGRPTCHVRFGEGLAILAGDALFALAFEIVSRIDGDPGRRLAATHCLARASGPEGLVGGEVIDVLSEGKPVDARTLEMIHRRKTGSLIAAACQIGGLLGGGSEKQVAALTEYGEHVGLAFQIADDYLNETSTPEQLGKASGSDRERGKATYPALYGLEATRTAAEREVEAAVSCLDGLACRDELATLARYSVERSW